MGTVIIFHTKYKLNLNTVDFFFFFPLGIDQSTLNLLVRKRSRNILERTIETLSESKSFY